MKRILTVFLFLLPIVAGLVMPGLWLKVQDSTPEEGETLDLSEPVLSYNPNKNAWDRDAFTELSGEELVHRLLLFASGPDFSLPQETGQPVDTSSWVYDHALNFLNAFFESPPEVTGFIIESRIAWFDAGITIPVWTVEMVFQGDYQCILEIDGESGLILRAVIHSISRSLDALFPETYAESGGEIDSRVFQARIMDRFCEAMELILSHYGDISVSVQPNAGIGSITLTFTQGETTSVCTSLRIHPGGEIWFNYPDQLEEEVEGYLVP